ncbi:surface lipoprotein assembly modifier [Rheinheimera salexigens]|uniref:Surface lipoprotein assembly modifier C-terminal domain-containing protein n=1 Tax=Rheinheimera salexigens TaxID=1628148 RepID=A0A1E7Q2B2_9GAMM|nr:surface lipoprotein assembly modifier [Rheinheimera salexigens]OEY68256.1 hypothetical protein BI198_00765 [Rheinheimera salexigens]
MALLTRATTIAATLCLLFSLPSHSSESLQLSAKARAGIAQQSNVNISELEQASGRSDSAVLLEAEVDATWQASTALQFTSGYSVQDTQYQHSADFNTRLHLGYLDASYQLGDSRIGANVYYALAELDSSRFLTLQQASLYSMHGLTPSWYIRPALTAGKKQFSQFSQRDADTLNVSADSFWFFANGQRFIAFGLTYHDEDSLDNAFSYTAPGVKLKLSSSYTLWHLDQQLQFSVKVSQRDYANVADNTVTNTDSDGFSNLNKKPNTTSPSRTDTHTQLAANWQLAINSHFAVITAIEHGDFSSSLDSADYRDTRSSVSLQLSF